jgi:hypothetical protein
VGARVERVNRQLAGDDGAGEGGREVGILSVEAGGRMAWVPIYPRPSPVLAPAADLGKGP